MSVLGVEAVGRNYEEGERLERKPGGVIDAVSAIFSESLRVYVRGFGLFFALWALFVFPLNIVQVVFFPKTAIPVGQGLIKASQVQLVGIQVVTALVTLALTLATVAAVEEIRRRRLPRVGNVYLGAMRRYLPTLLTSLVLGVVVVLPGMALFWGSMLIPDGPAYLQVGMAVLGMILLLLSFIVALPIMVLLPPTIWNEGRWWWQGTERIRRLLRHRWGLAWLTLLAGVAAMLVAYGAGTIVALVLTGIVSGSDPTGVLSSRSGLAFFAVLGTLLEVLIQPFFSVLSAVLYHSLTENGQTEGLSATGSELG